MRSTELINPRRGRVGVVLLVVATAALALAGCRDSGKPVAHPSTSPAATASPTPSVDSSQAAATAEILAVFNGYKEANQRVNASGSDHPADELKKFLADPLLTRIVAGLVQNRQKGVYYAGTSTADPKVTQLKLTDQPPTATITSCEDYTNYRLTYRGNNSPVPVPSSNRRYITTYTATRYDPQGWLLNDANSDRGQTC